MSVVPIDPLLLNLLSQHVVQCQLHGEHIMPHGSLEHFNWSTLLEVLLSFVGPNKLSRTTEQFMSYVALLENARKMESGKLDQEISDISVQVLGIVTHCCSYPELDPIQGTTLNSLVQEGTAVLNLKNNVSESAVKNYSKMLFNFVNTAMTCYKKLPAGEVFVAALSTPVKPKREKKPRKTPKKAPQKIPKLELQATSINVDMMVGVGESDAYSSNLVKRSEEDILLPAESISLPLAEPISLPTEPISLPELSIDPNNVAATTAELMLKASDLEGEDKSIFDTTRASGTEMEWSSDESTLIQSSMLDNPISSDSPQKIDESSSSLFNKPFIKKGAWSEEESRCLTEGVKTIGEGKWKEIIAHSPTLRCRTSNQLKDRYRNIKGRSK